MRARTFALAALLLLVSSSCGGGDDDGGVSLAAITVAGAPTKVPVADLTPVPPPEVIVSAESVYQAGAMLVSVTGDITGGTVTTLGRTIPLSTGSQSLYTVVPVDTDAPVGEATMRIDFTTKNGSKGTLDQPFEVLETDWTQDSLSFTAQEVATLLDPVTTEKELAELRAIYSKVTPEKLWDGPWRVPVDAYVTGVYGEERSINGGPYQGHHSGTDFGANLGTEVHASNSGVVVLARKMTVRGNLVVINHGGGLYSAYAHLDSINVSGGQLVATGTVLGLSGTTGLSTAPHLHWEIAQSGVLLDAIRFTDGSNGI